MELIKDLGMIYPKPTSKNKYRYGMYLCYCNNLFRAKISHVKSGDIKSCGCLRKLKNKTHGKSNHKLFSVFNDMKTRCYNKNYKEFHYYGGRGIIICKEWLDDFNKFYNWALDNGYKQGLQIDRINVNGNYEPNNCRWVNRNIQARNTRKLMITNKSGYRGVSFKKDINKFIAQIRINRKTIPLGYSKCRLECAYMYDNYIIKNNLEHTRNFA